MRLAKNAPAIKILEKHPEADAGAEVTNLLVDLELKSGPNEAAPTARAQSTRPRQRAFWIALPRHGDADRKGTGEEALPLFRELRDPMIEVNEHDKFVKSLTAAAEQLPENTEALDCLPISAGTPAIPSANRGASPNSPMSTKQRGTTARTEQVLEELVDRNATMNDRRRGWKRCACDSENQ